MEDECHLVSLFFLSARVAREVCYIEDWNFSLGDDWFFLGDFLFSNSSLTMLLDKFLISLFISPRFYSWVSFLWFEELVSSFPLLLSPWSVLPLHFLVEVKFSLTSKETTWIWSKERDFLSLRVKPKYGSKDPAKTTLETTYGGLILAGRVLYNLLNLFMNLDTSSLCLLFVALN